jgi:acetyl esterase/lipase
MSRVWSVIRILGWIGIVAATCWLCVDDPRMRALSRDPARPSVLRDRLYRSVGAWEARLDIYLPPGPFEQQSNSRLRPGVLAIHGGSWIGGSKKEYGPQLERLARQGYALFVADYRLARPGAPTWPEALEDLREAVRWIRRHAHDYRVDPDHLIALGSGAGGHLAALLGTLPPVSGADKVSARVQAVVCLYGATDLEDLLNRRGLAHDPVKTFLGQDSPGETPRARAASPINHVSADDSPMLLFHGSDDLWVPPEQSERMARKLREAGVRHRLIVIPGARHGFELQVGYPGPRDLLPELLAFLETVWHVPLNDGS